VNRAYDTQAIADLTMQKSFATKWRELEPAETTLITVLASVEEAFEHVKQIRRVDGGDQTHVDALVTGSVHLVGRALGVLEGVDAV
jgi:folylpolyglutamate synthase